VSSRFFFGYMQFLMEITMSGANMEILSFTRDVDFVTKDNTEGSMLYVFVHILLHVCSRNME
jgi:hypothetical protein